MAKQVTVRWRAHTELSAAHAAYVVATGAPCNDSKTEQLLVEPVTELNNRLLSGSVDIGRFWHHYLLEVMNDRETSAACTIALLASGCSEMQVEQTSRGIASRLGEARQAFLHRFPKLAEQLELRARPLKDRWDTVGQGLLREIGRQVWADSPPTDWWSPRVTALTVQPVRGGDGGFDASQSKFWIEAMLTDVDPTVPEVLRVAWLNTQIAIESYTRDRSADLSLAAPWSLVSVPLVLTAAQSLELVPAGDLPIRRAMEVWQFGDGATADVLSEWWSGHLQSPSPLPAALKVLDERLPKTAMEPDLGLED